MKIATTSLAALIMSIGLVLLADSSAQAIDQNQLFEQSRKELSGQVSEKTLNDLQTLVQSDPANSQAHLNLGLVLDKLGLTEPAAEQFELAVRYGAANPDALVQLVKEELKAERTPAAMVILTEGVKKFPNNADMLFLVGQYLLSQKKINDAQRVLLKAYSINPSLPGLATALGQTVIDKNPNEAARLASRDLEKDHNSFSGLYLRGMAYRAVGRNREAIVDLQKVFDRQLLLPPVAEALSQLYYWQGDYEKALKPAMLLSVCTVLKDVESSGNLPNLMRILIKIPRDQVQEKVEKINVELALRRYMKPEFLYLLGKAFDGLDMPHEAIQQYSRSVTLDPNNPRAYYRMALDQELYTRDYQTALSNYQTANSQRPWDAEITTSYMRMQDRMHNRRDDIAWRFKDWLNKTFNAN